jgi:hypothetical protein
MAVALEEAQWPTADGFDSVLAPIGAGQGLFVQDGDVWTNAVGLTTTLDGLKAP